MGKSSVEEAIFAFFGTPKFVFRHLAFKSDFPIVRSCGLAQSALLQMLVSELFAK
jgi:hypothetical protein